MLCVALGCPTCGAKKDRKKYKTGGKLEKRKKKGMIIERK
jgi:hypothetical protein